MNDRTSSFDLGLVMAGAVSAGAYTAGVVDFLVQALDEWQRVRTTDQGVPKHDVRIRVMSGSSAGGIVAGLLAATFSEPPGTSPAREGGRIAFVDRLYQAWVNDADIEPLLGTSDLPNGAVVQSLLDSSPLVEIARRGFGFAPGTGTTRRRYVADPLAVILTMTNLRGVPYRISFAGDDQFGYPMTMHGDYVGFALSPADPRLPDVRWLNPRDPEHENWDVLRTAALATSAFPVGLAPRRMRRAVAEYDARRWPVPVEQPQGQERQCFEPRPIAPDNTRIRDPYEYWSVDGGLMDNEPLELARRTLSGGGSNPRHADQATRAVVLIDPFPAPDPTVAPQDMDIVGVLSGMIGALLQQARFKPQELALAQDETIYSRFLVAPRSASLACGALGGFAGFLCQRYRHHDFQLGRRNCQKFLMTHLAVPLDDVATNPVLRVNDEAVRQTFAFDDGGARYFPLIPLLGSARDEVPLVDWGTLRLTRQEVAEIGRLLEQRIRAVETALISGYVKSPVVRAALRIAARVSRGRLARAAVERAAKALEPQGLWGG